MDPLSPSTSSHSVWNTSPRASRIDPGFNSPGPSSHRHTSSASSFKQSPLPQSVNGMAHGAPGPALHEDGKSGPGQYFLRVRITSLERNRKDLLLRFDASTNLPNFRATLYRNMQRSYAEFQKFAEQAQVTSPQTIISALPLPTSSATTDEEDDRLVRIALQRWFTRICEDPVMMRDEELRKFVEEDFGYSPTPPPTARRPTSGAVPNVLSAALSKVVKRGPLDEDDELGSAKAALDKLEITWSGAASGVNALGKARRAHAVASQDVGAKLISLSTVESDFGLQGAERKVGRALETMAGVAGAQAASENVILSDSLGYQSLNARAAKDALIQRTQLLEDAQTATKTAITKRRNVERLKGSSNINPSKVDDAISEMEDANALETQLGKQLGAISTNLHLALRQHSRHTHEDTAMALLENARLSVGFHKHALKELEIARAELGRVNASAEVAPVKESVRANVQESARVDVQSQSMFLPPQTLGSPYRGEEVQTQPMAQSMMVPPRGQIKGGRRLDERQAARMLAGGF